VRRLKERVRLYSPNGRWDHDQQWFFGFHQRSRFLSLPHRFYCGFMAVLLFHQGILSILHAVGSTPVAAFPTQVTKPFGLPQIWSLAFWGGVWGLVLARVDRWFPRGTGYWVAACIFGAIFLSLVAWLVVFPLKGVPAGRGWHAAGLATGLMINGGWGLGTALLLQGLSKGWRSGSLGVRP
jgi:hypothetical protein